MPAARWGSARWRCIRPPTRDALHVRFADEKVCIGPPGGAPELPVDPRHHQRRRGLPGRRGPPRLRLPLRERPLRRGGEEVRPPLDRPAARDHAPDGRQGLAPARRWRRRACRSSPGTGVIDDERDAEEAVERIGLPVIIKASAGGGGRGMKIVESKARLSAQLAAARSEAQAGFGNPNVYLERYVEPPAPRRGPGAGRRHGGRSRSASASARSSAATRSWSRRRPASPSTTSGAASCWAIARKATESLGYQTVGTLEFLLDEDERLLLHGDEHPHPGRAPRHRGGDRRRPGARADASWRRASRSSCRRTSARAATPSSAGSTPRTRSPSRRRRGASPRSTCRAGWASASTPTSTTSTWCPPSMIRCWPS